MGCYDNANDFCLANKICIKNKIFTLQTPTKKQPENHMTLCFQAAFYYNATFNLSRNKENQNGRFQPNLGRWRRGKRHH